MPYIPDSKRRYFDALMTLDDDLTHPGTLNYLITKLCLHYLKSKGKSSYRVYNDIIGALECAKQEFYRRLVVPYEDEKKIENGDVY